MPGSGPALFGMPDIDNLGVLTILYTTIGRQLASDDNADDRKRNCKYEKTVQTEGKMPESCTDKRQDAETQWQHNTENTTEPSIITNPTVIGNKNENNFPPESTNRDTNNFFSELIINEIQGCVSEQLREHDMASNAKQTSKRDNNKWMFYFRSS